MSIPNEIELIFMIILKIFEIIFVSVGYIWYIFYYIYWFLIKTHMFLDNQDGNLLVVKMFISGIVMFLSYRFGMIFFSFGCNCVKPTHDQKQNQLTHTNDFVLDHDLHQKQSECIIYTSYRGGRKGSK